MTVRKLLLLSGTPASGKDSVTHELHKLDPTFIHFKKHKIANGGKLDNTYELIDQETFDKMVNNDDFVQYHYRYGRGYGVSREALNIAWHRDLIPVIHVGMYANIEPFLGIQEVEATSVLLLTSFAQTRERLTCRHANDFAEIEGRLRAYAEERRELAARIEMSEKLNFNLILENTDLSARTAAHLISHIMQLNIKQT